MTLTVERAPILESGGQPSLLGPWTDIKKVHKSLRLQMEQARAAGLAVGWAISISRGDGSESIDDADGDAIVARDKVYYDPPKGTRYGTPKGVTHVKAVPMTPDQPMTVGSCAKTITAAAALAAVWAVETDLGKRKRHPADVQNTALTLPIFEYLPPHWDLDRINGSGRQHYWPQGANPDVPQTTTILLKHILQMRSYFLRSVDDRYTPPDHMGAVGYYKNLKECVRKGPVLTVNNNQLQQIGSGTGRYSNSGYCLLRLVIAYKLAEAGMTVGIPSAAVLNSAPWQIRDVLTCAAYATFVQDHLFRKCGVEGFEGSQPGVAYYNIDAAPGSEFYELFPDHSAFLDAGAGGWTLSANQFRLFLLGLQAGKPFGDDASWWWDLMFPNWLGADCPWLGPGSAKNSRIQLPDGSFRLAYTKNGGSGFPFPPDYSVEAWASAELFVSEDITMTLLVNSGHNAKPSVPVAQVLRNAFLAGFK